MVLLIPQPEEAPRAPRVLVIVTVVSEEAAQAGPQARAGTVAAMARGGAAAAALLLVGAGAGAVPFGTGEATAARDDRQAVADAEGVEEAHCVV